MVYFVMVNSISHIFYCYRITKYRNIDSMQYKYQEKNYVIILIKNTAMYRIIC